MNKSLSMLLLCTVGALAAPVEPARIAAARELVARSPALPDGYVALAQAYLRAARDLDQPSYLSLAHAAVADALKLTPENFEARKAGVAILIAEGRFVEGLEQARILNKKVPDDNLMYGWIADAELALGRYDAAEKAAQWMIDMKPVNAPGLQHGALLREMFGYNEPAIEWWTSALRITSASDTGERAWILSNLSRVSRRIGKATDAEKYARQALELVPKYPWANDALAAALVEQGKSAEAVDVLRGRLAEARNLQAGFHLAAALELAHNPAAADAWKQFEKDATAQVAKPANANAQLIEFYASHGRLKDAVRLAVDETARRQDVETLSAYALALVADARYDEARTQMDRVLAVGIRDAKLFVRAGMIAAKLNDKVAAAKYFKKAIEINASSPDADQAIHLLASLS